MTTPSSDRWGWLSAAVSAVAAIAGTIVTAVVGRRAPPAEDPPPTERDPFDDADHRVDDDRARRRRGP